MKKNRAPGEDGTINEIKEKVKQNFVTFSLEKEAISKN